MKLSNAEYDIIHQVNIGDKHFVTGHNPRFPAPYVTWEYIKNGDYFYQGHYFTNAEDAILDMFQRAGKELDLHGQSLGMALLSQEDRKELNDQFRDEMVVEEIAFALESLASGTPYKYDIDGLMNNELFMASAQECYYDIDHSFENEAFQAELESILEKYPQYKIPEIRSQSAVLKIAPEQKELVQAMLSTPCSKLQEIYGPLGDNLEFYLDLDAEHRAVIELQPVYSDPEELTLSSNEPHHIAVKILDESDIPLSISSIESVSNELLEPTAAAELRIHLGEETICISLQEDEDLRRTGNQFIFKAISEESLYSKHNGETCTVKRALTPKECDVFISGLMWEAEFPDGDLLHVFDRELQPPPQEKKLPLDQQIGQAKNKTVSPTIQQDQTHKAER